MGVDDVRVTFKANRAGILAAARSEGVHRDLDRRGDRVISAAAASVAEKTGDYRRGLQKEHIRARGAAGVRITATAPHSATREFGSRPHVIEARNGKALAWPGGAHPVRRVNHPGTPAFHTLRTALRVAGR
jgi:hypothetical protein